MMYDEFFHRLTPMTLDEDGSPIILNQSKHDSMDVEDIAASGVLVFYVNLTCLPIDEPEDDHQKWCITNASCNCG